MTECVDVWQGELVDYVLISQGIEDSRQAIRRETKELGFSRKVLRRQASQ